MKNTLSNWRKVPLREALDFTKTELQTFARSGAVRFLPVFIVYGLSLIFLLKVAQETLM